MPEQTFAAQLRQAIRESFSGTIVVRAKDELRGEVLLSDGQIAWATCRGQTDTLGVCLWRLGRLSREQLDMLRKAYEANQRRKKLGELFEELGLMSGPVLRRCLLLHTRSAVTRLLADSKGEATQVESGPRAEDNYLFAPEEVLPPTFWPDGADSVELTQSHRFLMPTLENSVIEDLSGITGHLASAIISADGEVLTGYVTTGDIKLSVLGAFLAGAVEASSRLMAGTPLRDLEELMVDCAGGWAAIRWVDPKHKFLAVVLLDRTGNPSIARYALKRAIPQILTWLERGGLVEAGDQTGRPPEAPVNPFESRRDIEPAVARPEAPVNPFEVRRDTGERRRVEAMEPKAAAADPFAVKRERTDTFPRVRPSAQPGASEGSGESQPKPKGGRARSH